MLALRTSYNRQFSSAGVLNDSSVATSKEATETFPVWLQRLNVFLFFLFIAKPQPHLQGVPKKTDTQFYFWDNFGNSAPILTCLLYTSDAADE